MHSIKQEIRTTEPVSPEIPTSVFVIALHLPIITMVLDNLHSQEFRVGHKMSESRVFENLAARKCNGFSELRGRLACSLFQELQD